MRSPSTPLVIRGLDPRIHHASREVLAKRMDCRVKPGNDILVSSLLIAATDRHVQRPAFRHRHPELLGRSLPRARQDAEGCADRVRAAARLDGVHPARRHLHAGEAHRRVLLASAGRADERADGAQHDAQGWRCAHERTAGDVSRGVAAHGARYLGPAVSGPCRPHPRRTGAARRIRSLQGASAAAVGGVPEGCHRADQHALPGHGRVVAGDDRRHRQLHRQQGGRGALPRGYMPESMPRSTTWSRW